MAQATFTIDDFSLSSSWVYAEAYDDVGDVTVDYKSGGSATTVDKTFTISGIDASIINSITLTWDVSASASGSITKPTSGYGHSYSKVYPGAQNSNGGVSGSTQTLTGLTSILSGNSITCRFYYKPGIAQYDHDTYQGFGMGSCTGTVYFKNVTLTVVYGEDRDDSGMGAWIGVDGISRHVKNMYIGVDNVARKVKAAWIGVNGLARLFYQSIVKSLASIGCHSQSTSTGQITVENPNTGYAGYAFPAENKYASCTKVTLHFYINSSYGNLNIYVKNGGNDWQNPISGLVGNISEYSPSGNGWQEVDITADFDASKNGVSRDNAAKNGLKIYFRGWNLTKLAGTSTDKCPYIIIE